MSNRITFDAINTPDFRGANSLLVSGGQQYQDAIKGLTDTLKGVQTEVRSKNDALVQAYINQATTAEQLQSPEFRQGFQDTLSRLGNEYDAGVANKSLDTRVDTLKDRQLKEQQLSQAEMNLKLGKQTYDTNETKLAQDAALAAMLGHAGLGGDGALKLVTRQDGLDQFSKNHELAQGNQRIAQQNANTSSGELRLKKDQFEADAPIRTVNNLVAQGQTLATYANNPALAGNWTPEQVRETQMFGNAIVGASKARSDGQIPYASYAAKRAQELGLDPNLVNTIIAKESSFNPDAKSPAGAVGLGQLIPATAQRFGLDPNERNHPYKNIDASVKYIKHLANKFGNDPQKIFIGYHSGEGAVDGVLRNPQGNPKSTADWQRSMRIYQALQAGNGGGSVILPEGLKTDTYSGTGTGKSPKFSDTATGILTNAANNIGTFNAGIVADRAKAMNDNTVNADTWLKDAPSFGNGIPKTLYSMLKGDYANGQKGEIIKGADQLTPAQQAQALEIANQSYEQGKASGTGELFVTTSNLSTAKSHLQNAVNSLLKGDADKSKAYALSQIDNAVRTVVARDGMSAGEALNSMGISDDLKKAYIDNQQGKSNSTPTAQNAAKGASNLQKSQQEAKAKQYQEAKQQAEQARIARERKDQLAKAAEDKRKKDEENRKRMGIFSGQSLTARDNPFTARS